MIDWLRRARTTEPSHAIESVLGQGVPAILPEDVYHDAARHFLDVQTSAHDALDNKNSHTLSVGSVVLPVTFVLLNLSSRAVPVFAVWALGVALGCYIGLLVCAGRASFVHGLEYRPDIQTLREHSNSYPGRVLRRWVADEYHVSIEKNKRVLVRKARWIGRATFALYLEAISLSIAAIATLLL